METEIEAKWLSINAEQIRALLKKSGAKLEHPERLMTRANFDFPDDRLEKVGGWVRVRDEGDKITLSYKQLNDRTLHGTQEVNLVVSSFKDTCTFLESIGLVQQSFQETRRESWKLDGAEVEIDTWPWIPTFLEIEAKTEEIVRQTAKLLELDFAEALHGSVEVAYQAVYEVTDEEIDHWDKILFSPVPKWLEAKKK